MCKHLKSDSCQTHYHKTDGPSQTTAKGRLHHHCPVCILATEVATVRT
jgi:hypothetical protein